MKPIDNLKNQVTIVNTLLQEESKIILIPTTLHTRLNEIKSVAKVDLQRLTTEALLHGIKKIEKKYIPVN